MRKRSNRYRRINHGRRLKGLFPKACEACLCDRLLTVHHIISVEDNGSNDMSNLVTLCRTCHEHYVHGLGRRGKVRAWPTNRNEFLTELKKEVR